MKFSRWIIPFVFIAIWSISGVVSAQGGAITYGETRTETLNASAPQLLYSLQGNADEVLTVYVLGWVEAFQPSITILGPTGQLAFTTTDALTPMTNDARATVKLPQAGSYSILVGSATPVLDTFTIAIRNTTAGISTQLGTDPITIDIPPGGESVAYTISASPDSSTPIAIASGTPDFMFAGYISAPDGRILVAFDGALPSVNAVLPAGTEPYMLIVQASDPSMGGRLTISQTGAAASPPAGDPVPVVTEEVTTGANPPPANECAAVANPSGANVRTGPSTDFPVLRIMAPGDFMIITAQNSGWYTDGEGWVAGSVVTLTGPCDGLGVANVDAQPAATPVPTLQPTTAPTDTTQPTATYTYTPTTEAIEATPTYTYTPTTAAQIAVVDNDQLNLVVDRDNGGTYTNDVSSPEGDTTDRIRITIDNLTNQTPNNFREISILVTCIGAESANLRWGTGGPTSPNSRGCNESLTAVHTNDSNQTFVNIAMEGPGYAQYALVVTILR